MAIDIQEIIRQQEIERRRRALAQQQAAAKQREEAVRQAQQAGKQPSAGIPGAPGLYANIPPGTKIPPEEGPQETAPITPEPEVELSETDKTIKQKMLDMLQPVMPSTDLSKLSLEQLKQLATKYQQALQQYYQEGARRAAAQALDVENWAKEHNITIEQALAELSQKLNIPEQQLQDLIKNRTLVDYFMQQYSLGKTDALLKLSRDLGLTLSELNKLIENRGLIDDYASRHNMTVAQAWQDMAQFFDLPVDKLQELVRQYRENPTATTWATMPPEFRERLAGLAQVKYEPVIEYRRYIEENYIPVGTNISPSTWQKMVIQEYADTHNMTWKEAHALINKLRDTPNAQAIKDLSDKDRAALEGVVSRLALGKDYISKQDYAALSKDEQRILKTKGFDALQKLSASQWESELQREDPEGFKVYYEAGRGDAGTKAYEAFVKERQDKYNILLDAYSDTQKVEAIEGIPVKQYIQSGREIPEGFILKGNSVFFITFDTLKIVSDYNNKKLSQDDAVAFFGKDILDTIKQVNTEYVQSPFTGEWFDKESMEELAKSDINLYTILFNKGTDAYDKELKARQSTAQITEATAIRDAHAAVIKAVADAATQPTIDKQEASASWNAWHDYREAEAALLDYIDEFEKENPGMSKEESGRIIEASPVYKQYLEAKDTMLNTPSFVDDALAEFFSRGEIPTLSYNRDQLGQMYDDNLAITLAIYTGDNDLLKKLYDNGSFLRLYGEDKDEALKGYKGALLTVAQQDAIKKAVNTGNLGELKRLQLLGALDDKSYSELSDYVKTGGRELAPITSEDIKEVAESIGTKKEWIENTAKQYPTGSSMLQELIISMIPIVGTIRNWDKMGAGGKALSVITDILIMWPFVSAAARAARAAKGIETGLSIGGRLQAVRKALAGEARAQAKAPIDIVIHPIRSAKGIGRGLRDIAGVFDPRRVGEFVSTLSPRVIRIPISSDMSYAQIRRAVLKALDEAGTSGGRIIWEEGNIKVVINRGKLMEEIGGGMVHASPDVKELLESRTVAFKEGLPSEEQGLFFSLDPALEFTSGSAFGKGVIPVANKATGIVEDISKYRVKDLVRIDKAPIRSLDFANARNVPDDLALSIQDYTRKNRGVLYGSMNAYTKLKKAPVPNDLDLAFSNQSKALKDIENIAKKLGYKTRRVPHAIEILDNGKWVQVADVADISKHITQIPKGLSHQVLTKIDGIRTETMGEQYLRQSYGAVSETEKAATRAEVVNKIAKEVRQRLKEAGAEKKQPGFLIVSPESAAKKIVPTEKTYHGVEFEGKYKVGEEIVTPGAKIQRLHARIGPLSDRVEFYIEFNLKKPLSLRQIAKLKALELVEMARAPFRKPLDIKGIKTATATTKELRQEMGIFETILRDSGNTRAADELARITRIETGARGTPRLIARAAAVGGAAVGGELAGVRPVAAKKDEVAKLLEKANREESRGNTEKANKHIREAMDLLENPPDKARLRLPETRDALNIPAFRNAVYNTRPVDERAVERVIESVPALRAARDRGEDARVEANRMIIDARRAIKQDMQKRQLKTIRASTTRKAIAPVTRISTSRFRVPPGEMRVPRVPKIPPPVYKIKIPPIRRKYKTRTRRDLKGKIKPTEGKRRKKGEEEGEVKKLTPEQIRNAVAFRMGKLRRKNPVSGGFENVPVTYARIPPYQEGDTRVFVGDTPAGMKVSPNMASAKKTIQSLGGGKVPKLIEGRIGFQQYEISRATNKPGAGKIDFKPLKSKKKMGLYLTDVRGGTLISRRPLGRRRRRRTR